MTEQDSRTIYCGNLSHKCTENILHELFMQAGPVEKVSIPKDSDGYPRNFGFVTYKHYMSVPYALNLFEGTKLFNKVLNLKTRPTPVEQDTSQILFNPLNQNNPMFQGPILPGLSLLPMYMQFPGLLQYQTLVNQPQPPYIDNHNKPEPKRDSNSRSHPYHHDRDKRNKSHARDRGRRNYKNHRSNDHHRHNNGRNHR